MEVNLAISSKHKCSAFHLTSRNLQIYFKIFINTYVYDSTVVYDSKKKKNQANLPQYETDKIIYGKVDDAISHDLKIQKFPGH